MLRVIYILCLSCERNTNCRPTLSEQKWDNYVCIIICNNIKNMFSFIKEVNMRPLSIS